MSRFAFFASLALCGLAFAPDRAAAAGEVYAWVRADQPSTASYVPAAAFSRNSWGGTNSIEHIGVGQYVVHFGDLDWVEGGNVQVSAYGADNARCMLAWVNDGNDSKNAIVVCHNAAGDYADTKFTASFTRYFAGQPGQGDVGYALIDNPTGWVDDPTDDRRFSTSSQAIGFHRLGAGAYSVRFWGVAESRPNFRVTTFGFLGNNHCKLAAVGGNLAGVYCFDNDGNFVDQAFSISYDNGNIWSPVYEGHMAVSASGVMSNAYNAINGTMTVNHTGTGFYFANFSALGSTTSGGIAQVTANNSGSTVNKDKRCKASDWTVAPGGYLSVAVRCFTRTGLPSDSAFTVSFVR